MLQKISSLYSIFGKTFTVFFFFFKNWHNQRNVSDLFIDWLSGSDGKESASNVGDLGSIPGLGRYLGEGNDNPLQYCCLENSMDRRAWQATVHGVAKIWTRLSNFQFHLVLMATKFWKHRSGMRSSISDQVPRSNADNFELVSWEFKRGRECDRH